MCSVHMEGLQKSEKCKHVGGEVLEDTYGVVRHGKKDTSTGNQM